MRASAGSGKTHRLALRYISVLLAGGSPDTIVAATFTRQAAAQITARVLTRLARGGRWSAEAARLGEELDRPELDVEVCRRALRRLCARLDRLAISTLDSFFYRWTGSLRFELGLLARPVMAALDDPLATALRDKSLEQTLEDLAGEGWAELLELLESLERAPARRSVAQRLDRMLLELYEVFLQAPHADVWHRLPVPPAPSAAELSEAITDLEALIRKAGPGRLRRALERDVRAARREQWQQLLARGVASKVAEAGTEARYAGRSLPERWVPSLQVLVAMARSRVLAAAARRTSASHRFLATFHRRYWSLRREQGLLLFSDLAPALVAFLESRGEEALAELYYRLDGRVGHLLLDEFQDTSLDQWSVLRPIAEELRAYGDGSRTFFCVGDPKQAIYGWRGGCADLFGQIEEDLRLEPSAGERLDTSFRSSQVVLDAVNEVFGGLEEVPALEEHRSTLAVWKEAFFEHRARRRLPGFVELRESEPGGEHRVWAAERVAGLCERLEGASVGVLVQTNEERVACLEEIRQLGVDASSEGGSPVADDPATAALIAALVLADHPGDTVAAFHVYHSPLRRTMGLESLSPQVVRRAARRARRRWWEEGAETLVASWVESIAPVCDGRGRARLRQAHELTRRFAGDRGLRPAALAELLDRAEAESPGRSAVRVMTIHRSKGLEFDVVVLPELDRRLLGRPEPRVYLQRRSPLAPVEAVHRSVAAPVRRSSAELEEAWSQERARRLRDDLSTLYVAVTRARYALFLWTRQRRSPRALSFATVLQDTLGRARAGSAEDQGSVYRRGELGDVVAALGERGGERDLPHPSSGLAPRAPSGDPEPSPRRSVLPLQEAQRRGAWSGAEILASHSGAPGTGAPDGRLTRSIESLSGSGPQAHAAVSWLVEGDRRLRETLPTRRFAFFDGERVVAGSFDRVWVSSHPEAAPRILVLDVADPDPSSSGDAEGQIGERRRLLRAAAARTFGAAETEVGVLSMLGDDRYRF